MTAPSRQSRTAQAAIPLVHRCAMSPTLEPREVDKPFIQRWLLMTLKLFVRSPVRFGIPIALLGWLDTSAVKLAEGAAVEKQWVDRVGMLLLPILWIFVSAIARGADDPSQTWTAFARLGRKRVWGSALTIGATLATSSWLIAWLFQGSAALLAPRNPRPYLQHPGQLLDSLSANVLLIFFFVGLCYFPLLVLMPDISSADARALSNRASDINGWIVIVLFIGAMAIGADALASVVSAYGMTTAAYLVFMGALSYVAYRDIFERRSGNLPKAVAGAQVRGPAHVTR